MKEPDWLVRVIEYFSNETDELIGEIPLPKVELSELQKLWDMQSDNPMIECYLLEKEQAQFFHGLVDIDFDFSQFSYFLTAFTTDWEATKRDGGYMGLFPPPIELPAFPEAKRVTPNTES